LTSLLDILDVSRLKLQYNNKIDKKKVQSTF